MVSNESENIKHSKIKTIKTKDNKKFKNKQEAQP